jgi:acetyltransferase-like isoleucine patch superfamily enzyme
MSKIASYFGRENYTLDKELLFREKVELLFLLAWNLLRGTLFNLVMYRKAVPLFKSRGVRIKNHHRIKIAKNVSLKRGVVINGFVKKQITIGEGTSLHETTVLEGYGGIRALGESCDIGKNVGFSRGCFIQIRGPVVIGDGSLFGPNVMVFSESHNFNDSTKHYTEQGESRSGVTIGENCWLGAGTIVLDGSAIGDNVIVGAGSVVKGVLESNSIYAGSPARMIKRRA